MPEFKKHSKSVTVSKIVTESFRGNDEAALKMNQQNGETECEKLKNGETEHQRLQNGESEHERQVADDTSAIDALQGEELNIYNSLLKHPAPTSLVKFTWLTY